jgi:hypothetical protein
LGRKVVKKDLEAIVIVCDDPEVLKILKINLPLEIIVLDNEIICESSKELLEIKIPIKLHTPIMSLPYEDKRGYFHRPLRLKKKKFKKKNNI